MAAPADGELLHRARQGDAAAFAALIRRHDKNLYRIARSVLSDDQEAEDAVQETYVRAFAGLRDFRAAASLRAWLTRIVLNEAIRLRRRRRSMLDLDVLHAAQERTPRPIHSSSLTAREPDLSVRLPRPKSGKYWRMRSTSCLRHSASSSSYGTWRRVVAGHR